MHLPILESMDSQILISWLSEHMNDETYIEEDELLVNPGKLFFCIAINFTVLFWTVESAIFSSLQVLILVWLKYDL